MTELIQGTLDFIAQLDPIWAPVVFILLYITATVLFVPGSLTTLAAGILFGVIAGSIYVSIASTTGAALAFLIGRYVLRDWVTRKVKRNPKLAAVDEAIGKKGAKIVFLLRLSPVFPFSLMNYALGLTRVSFGTYVLTSWIGMLPGTVLYVYLGSLFKSIADLSQGGHGKSTTEWTFYALGLIATLVVSLYISKIAKQAVAKTL